MKKILVCYIKPEGSVDSILIIQDKNGVKVQEKIYLSFEKDSVNLSDDKKREELKAVNEIIVILSNNLFMTRKLNFPFLDPNKIKQAIYLEMGPELPIKENNLIYDFLYLNKSKNESNVLAIAGDKSYVDNVYNSFKCLNPKALLTCTVDIQCFMSLLESIKLDNVALLYEDNDCINLIYKTKNSLEYQKIYINLQHIDDIEKKYGLIEYFLCDTLKLNGNKINVIFIPSITMDKDLIEKFKNIDKYQVINLYDIVKNDKEYLKDYNVDSFINNIFFASIYLNKTKNKLVDFGKKAHASLKEVLLEKKFLWYVVPVLLSLIFIFFEQITQYYFLKKYNRTLTSKINKIFHDDFPSIKRELNTKQIISVYRGKINDMQDTTKKSHITMDPLIILRDISLAKSDNVNLIVEQFSFMENRLIIKGSAPSLDILTEFRENISKNNKYKFSLKQANWDKDKNSVYFIAEITR